MKVLGGVVVETACAEFGWRPFLDTDLKGEDAPWRCGPTTTTTDDDQGEFQTTPSRSSHVSAAGGLHKIHSRMVYNVYEWCTMYRGALVITYRYNTHREFWRATGEE